MPAVVRNSISFRLAGLIRFPQMRGDVCQWLSVGIDDSALNGIIRLEQEIDGNVLLSLKREYL